jgi:hypothetical protein
MLFLLNQKLLAHLTATLFNEKEDPHLLAAAAHPIPPFRRLFAFGTLICWPTFSAFFEFQPLSLDALFIYSPGFKTY